MIQWLRIGAAAAGMAAALAATPGIASADDAGQSASPSSGSNAGRSAATSQSAAGSTQAPTSTSRRPGSAASVNGLTRTRPTATVAGSRATERNRAAAAAAVRRAPAAAIWRNAAPPTGDAPVASAAGVTPVGSSVSSTAARATSGGPLSDAAAFFGLPAAPSSSGTIEGVGMYVGLQLRDIFSPQTGTIDATSAVTGVFREVLRRDPSAEELQSYAKTFAARGLNGVVAGVYSSSEFHQQELQGYYTQMLGRRATDAELASGAFRLTWGTPPERIVAGIAAGREFFSYSDQSSGVTGGQTVGTPAVAVPPVEPTPTATSYVNLLYRSLLGQAPDPVAAQGYVQALGNAGPIARGIVAHQFTASDAYRAVQVKDIYQVVLGLNVATTGYSVQQYVDNWLVGGGLQGTTTQFLTGSANVTRMSAVGGVPLPDMASALLLQQILLAAYTAEPNGFVELLKLGLKQTMVDGKPAPCQTDCASAEALRKLIASGAPTRGIPNSSIVINPADYAALQQPSVFFNVSALRPTQNDIDMDNSIKYPLQHADNLATVLQGGDITVETGRIMTADNGQYILDGHHRWSSVFMMNPDARIASIDLGYVPNAQDGLKEAQLAIAAQDGYLPFKDVFGQNLFTVPEQLFRDTVKTYIDTGADPAAVMAAFATYKNLQTMAEVQDYLWGNVLQMRDNNVFVDGATPRKYMPQPLGNDYTPYLDYMNSQVLSYTLPVVSYLG